MDFEVVRFLAATFGSVPLFFFSDTRDLLAFFAVFPEDFATFTEDRAPFEADALEDFGLFPAEVLAEAVFFTGCFFEVFLESLPEWPLANFLPDRLLACFLPDRAFLDARRAGPFFLRVFSAF